MAYSKSFYDASESSVVPVKKGNQAFTFNRVKGKKQDFYPPLVIQNKTVDNGFFPGQSM